MMGYSSMQRGRRDARSNPVGLSSGRARRLEAVGGTALALDDEYLRHQLGTDPDAPHGTDAAITAPTGPRTDASPDVARRSAPPCLVRAKPAGASVVAAPAGAADQRHARTESEPRNTDHEHDRTHALSEPQTTRSPQGVIMLDMVWGGYGVNSITHLHHEATVA